MARDGGDESMRDGMDKRREDEEEEEEEDEEEESKNEDLK